MPAARSSALTSPTVVDFVDLLVASGCGYSQDEVNILLKQTSLNDVERNFADFLHFFVETSVQIDEMISLLPVKKAFAVLFCARKAFLGHSTLSPYPAEIEQFIRVMDEDPRMDQEVTKASKVLWMTYEERMKEEEEQFSMDFDSINEETRDEGYSTMNSSPLH